MPELQKAQWERFAQEYVRCLKPGEAAERVGFSNRYGYELINHPDVERRISEVWQEVGSKLKVDQHTVVREAVWVATSDITHVLECATFEDLRELAPAVRRAIKKVRRIDGEDGSSRLEIEMHDKLQALKLLFPATGADQGKFEGGEDDEDNELMFTGMEVKHLPAPEKGGEGGQDATADEQKAGQD